MHRGPGTHLAEASDSGPSPPLPCLGEIEMTITTSDRMDAAAWGPLARLREDRHRRISEAAYFKAEKRGFAPGHEVDDWLAAEEEIDAASRPLLEG